MKYSPVSIAIAIDGTEVSQKMLPVKIWLIGCPKRAVSSEQAESARNGILGVLKFDLLGGSVVDASRRLSHR